MLYGNHDIVKKNARFAEKKCTSFPCNTCREAELFPGIVFYPGVILKNITYDNYSARSSRTSAHTPANREIYLTHGHQADFFNSVMWRTSRFLVRYVWRPLEAVGFLDPTSAAKNNTKKRKVERILTDWADKNACILITGHTHRPMLDESVSYCNTGSCVHPRCVTCIEIERLRITLVKWTLATHPDRSLYVAREVLSGPFPLEG